MPELYDIAIVGSGPAGLSAALTAKARGLNIVWFGNKDISKKVSLAKEIRNYPGMIAVTGQKMQEIFQAQMDAEDLVITENVINRIFPMGGQYALFSGKNSWMAKTVLLAMGTAPHTTMKGESEFLGKGVSCCATCDGRLYTGKKIAVYCTGPEFEPEVEFLADLAAEVFVYHTYPEFSVKRENITELAGEPVEVLGDDFVSGIRIKRKPGEAYALEAAEASRPDEIEVDGVFCLKDSYSPATILDGLATEKNHIRVNRRQETSLAGCYAAGDCTGRPYQYAKAVGEGNVAIHSILDYLNEMDKRERE